MQASNCIFQLSSADETALLNSNQSTNPAYLNKTGLEMVSCKYLTWHKTVTFYNFILSASSWKLKTLNRKITLYCKILNAWFWSHITVFSKGHQKSYCFHSSTSNWESLFRAPNLHWARNKKVNNAHKFQIHSSLFCKLHCLHIKCKLLLHYDCFLPCLHQYKVTADII